MKHKRNLIVGIILGTATAVAVLMAPPSPNQALPPSVDSRTASPTDAPDSPPTASTCAYQWAYHDAPELTESLNAAVKALNSEAEARADFFGEDCVYADSTSTFSAMETDFYVRLPVEDLSKEEDFGNWVAQVMNVVLAIPHEQLQGPRDGFVEFTFEKNSLERIIFRVDIQKYKDEAQGKSGTELLQLFYNKP